MPAVPLHPLRTALGVLAVAGLGLAACGSSASTAKSTTSATTHPTAEATTSATTHPTAESTTTAVTTTPPTGAGNSAGLDQELTAIDQLLQRLDGQIGASKSTDEGDVTP